MASTVELTRLKFNRATVSSIIKSSKMRAALLAEAEKVAADANARSGGAGYAAWADDHEVSSHAHVTTTGAASIRDNIKNNTLVDALMGRCHG